jgi:hypothetical protein
MTELEKFVPYRIIELAPSKKKLGSLKNGLKSKIKVRKISVPPL